MKHLNYLKQLLLPVLLLLMTSPAAFAVLNGTYTVGGASPNYASLSAAITDLNNQGVNGPVVFNIRSGTYTGTTAQGMINQIAGASSTNTITFQAESGAGTVTLSPAGSTHSNNFVFGLNNANWIIIKDLTLNNTGTTYGCDVQLVGSASNNTVTNCILTGNTSTGTSYPKSRVLAYFANSGFSTTGFIGANNKVLNSSMPAGNNYGVYIYGNTSATSHAGAFEVSGCNIVGYYGGLYGYYVNDLKFNNNILSKNTASSSQFYAVYLYDCDSTMEINNNTISAASVGSTYYGVYRAYCDGSLNKKQNITNNIATVTNTSTTNWIYYSYCQHEYTANNTFTGTGSSGNGLYAVYCDNSTIKNNTCTITGSSTVYGMYRLYGLISSSVALNDTIENNNVTVISTGSTAYNYCGYYATNASFKNNIINVSSTASSGSAVNYYYYGTNYVFANNTINVTATGSGTAYGCLMSHTSGAITNGIISNNKIKAQTGTGTMYGLYCYYPYNVEMYNNTITTISNTSGTVYTLLVAYPYGPTNIYNNTVYNQSQSTSTNYALYSYAYASYPGIVKYRNNIFAKSSANGPSLLYLYDGSIYNDLDYNCLYTPGATLAAYATGGTYANLNAWRTTGRDKNSISYQPVFVNASAGNFTPDPSNANNWCLQGRGIQHPSISTDINGSPRATTTSAGVPDLGAYEFTPNSGVLPPTCVASPATPVAGGMQTFTFGYDTVATVAWDAAATVPSSAPTVRQYTGTIPPGLNVLNPTNMYFYTDIQTSPNANYVANIYYKDPWMGTIAAESALHLAKKDGANPWIGYPLPGSAANNLRNYIYSASSPKLNTYGFYTGIDVPNNAATVAIVEPAGAFCPGTYAVKVLIRNAGNNVINSVKIDWELDFVAQTQINYTTPIPVNTGTPGINDVIINLGNISFGTTAHTFKVWTSLPNGVSDPIAQDDTLGPMQVRAALAGDYTVGGTTPDFATPVAAVTALKSAGMCGPVTFKIRAGTYVGNLDISGITGSNIPNRRITFRADDNVAASAVNIIYGATGTADNYVVKLNGTSYITFKNLSLTATGASYGWIVNFNGTSNDDSVIGCNLSTGNTVSSTNFCAFYGGSGSNYANLKIYNNNINAAFGTYLYPTNSGTLGTEIVGNNITSFYSGIYYVIYHNGMKVNYNTITSTTGSSPYGIYYLYQQGSNPSEFIGNKITGFYYGAYYLYNWSGAANNRSKILNNVIAYDGATAGQSGLFVYSPAYTTIANNTVCLGGAANTSGYAGYIYLSSYSTDSVYNNVFANYANGYGVYTYLLSGYNHYWDYNNTYTSGSTLMYDAGYGAIANMGTWRTSTPASNVGGADKNSISYDPGINKLTGMPDLTNPNSWTMHGRGRHSGTTALDITGYPRPATIQDGVPDLGAYEFEPTAIAPNAIGTPAIPAPGLTQTYTLGYNTVATVAWNTQLALTSPLNVKQYSGVVAPANFMTVSQNKYPYFYTDIAPTGLGSTYDVNLTLNYYDTWLGKIPTEANMKLAQKFSLTPWVSYNAANSSTNATNNTIYAAGVTTFGAFTGIDDGVNFSAIIKVVGSVVMCTGKSVTLNANPVSGGSSTYTYQWKRNGTAIVGATTPTYIVTTGGDYTVAITATSVFPNITAESIPTSVTVVAPPMAMITPSGALTYCIGNGLTLSAPPGAGLSYQWTLNGTNLGTAPTQPVTSAGSYKVIVKNIGCADTSDQTIINAGPIAVNLGSDVAGCEIKGTPYILDAGYPGARYTWSTGDTTQTIAVYKGSGVYSVTVDAGPNCNGTDQVAVNLNPLPSVTGISFMRTGNTYNFSASGAQNVTSYLWIFSDGSTSTYPVVTKTFENSMTVKLIIHNDCGNDTVNMVNWAVGVNNTVNESLEANVYPNPAKDVVTFAVKGAIMKDVTVINALGEVVYRAEMGGAAKDASINVSAFAAGRYIIRSTTTEGIVSKPFNVQR